MNIASDLVPQLPKANEETWRRTDPSVFFVPAGEMQRSDGSPLVKQNGKLNSDVIQWNIVQNLLGSAEKILKRFDGSIVEENELPVHVCTLQINGANAVLDLTSNLQGFVTLTQTPVAPQALFQNSSISMALAERLALSQPQQLVLKIATPKTFDKMPIFIIEVNGSHEFSQSFNDLRIEIAENCAAEIVMTDLGSHFAHHRHSVELQKSSQLVCLWTNVNANKPGHKTDTPRTALLERTVTLHESASLMDMSLFEASGDSRALSNLVSNGRKSIATCGALIVSESGSMDYEPVHHHIGPEGETHLKAKMLGAGGVQAVFQGLIKVDEAAAHTVSSQINKNLLLSKRSRIDSLPKLEIVPNEVSCKHGSASGEVDAKQVYYLMTRGFTENAARSMVINSFASEGLYALPEGSFAKTLGVSLVNNVVGKLKVLAK